MKNYIKKPIPVKAIVWTGKNCVECMQFGEGAIEAFNSGAYIKIKTPEGRMRPNVGDYVVKGPKGEFWFVRKKIFEETYEEIK